MTTTFRQLPHILTLISIVALAGSSFARQGEPPPNAGTLPHLAPERAQVNTDTITMVVMDPLSSQLACDCVEGYAQRNYEKFGYYLSSRTERPVHVIFSDSLTDALKESKGKADIIIGKHSVVEFGAKEASIELTPVFRLTDNKDSVDQTGLLVVRANNPAKSVSDLKGYRVLFGAAACDEKYAAPRALLLANGIALDVEPPAEDICSACSVAAKKLMEVSDDEKMVAVISSYAQPLLEGCGNIQKGDLRVVGESKPVPFVTVFFNKQFSTSQRARVIEAFNDVELDAEMLTVLETGSGFVPWKDPTVRSPDSDPTNDSKKKSSSD